MEPELRAAVIGGAAARAIARREERMGAGGRIRRIRGACLVLAAMLAIACLGADCAVPGAGTPGCAPSAEMMAASDSRSLIAVVPRTSAAEADWALDTLARLLPYAARPGLQLHVLDSQDSDDLGEGGGDGGPPQVVTTSAPTFRAFQVTGAPPAPRDPNPLTEKLYCGHVSTWEEHARGELRAKRARRDAAVRAWALRTAARLSALARRPIPDTLGSESGVEIDPALSIFAAAEIAQDTPSPTIAFLGGLTSLRPPSQRFRFPARLIALVRSTDPSQVVHAETVWARWAHRAGGSFRALSANDTSATIGQALAGT